MRTPSRTLLLSVVITFAPLAHATDLAGGPAEPVATQEPLGVEVPAEDEEGVEVQGTVPPVVAEEEVAQPNEPKAWLRSEAREAEAEASPNGSSYLPVAAFALLALIAGAAVFLRQRGAKGASFVRKSAMNVVSQVRVGPKSSLVAVAVGERVLLLGVTEQQVSTVGWLDEPLEESAPSDPVEELTRPVTSGRGFSEMLAGALRPSAPGTANDAASLLAERTEDVVGRAVPGQQVSRLRQTSPRVETQVAGLSKRRRN